MPRNHLIYKAFISVLADRTGLEPATSAVTGRHSNQLNYRSFSVGVAKIGENIIQAKTNSGLLSKLLPVH
jgi:hypothetical protein